MSQDDSNDLQGLSSPDGQVPLPVGDADVNISNTGQRVGIVVVVLLLLGGLGAGLHWWNKKQAEITRHEGVRAAFEAAHRGGYAAFWNKSQINVKSMKTNKDFAARMHQILTDNPVRYGKHLQDQAIPVLAAAVPEYKKIEAPSEYADKVAAVAKAAEDMHDSWKAFAAELGRYKDFLEAKAKLSDHGNQWFGAQQSNNPKFEAKAQRYYGLLQCILRDKKIAEIEPNEVNNTVSDSCLNDKAAWFRRVAFECLPDILGEPSDEVKKEYVATVATFRKSRAERLDHNSIFGIEGCLNSGRSAFQEELTDALAKSWANYVLAQNSLISAIEGKLKELR
jgi:hypothetical protein